jgi:hypothetical protein
MIWASVSDERHAAVLRWRGLMLTTAAFLLMHTVRAAIPEGYAPAESALNTIRLRLQEIAIRGVEHASRLRAHLPTRMPDNALFRQIALGLMPLTGWPAGPAPQTTAGRATSTPNRACGGVDGQLHSGYRVMASSLLICSRLERCIFSEDSGRVAQR